MDIKNIKEFILHATEAELSNAATSTGLDLAAIKNRATNNNNDWWGDEQGMRWIAYDLEPTDEPLRHPCKFCGEFEKWSHNTHGSRRLHRSISIISYHREGKNEQRS